MKDAFGVRHELDEVSKANWAKGLKFVRRTKKATEPIGRGPGAQLSPGAAVRKVPAKPVGNFVTYDPIIAAQKQRAAMKASFGKRDSRKDPKPLHPLAVGAATAGGALAGQSAYMGVVPFNNHVMKPHFERKMKEYGPDSEQAKIWRDWNKPQEPRVRGKHSSKPWVDPGFRGGEKPSTEEHQRPFNRRAAEKEAQSNTKRAAWHGSKEFHRKFPRGLPGWRTHRALSYAGKGLSGHATAAAAMSLGALGSYKLATHQPKRGSVDKALSRVLVSSKHTPAKKLSREGMRYVEKLTRQPKSEVKKWGYVPKTAMTPKLLLQDPGFLAPVAGVTTLGVGGSALAARKYRKRKKK